MRNVVIAGQVKLSCKVKLWCNSVRQLFVILSQDNAAAAAGNNYATTCICSSLKRHIIIMITKLSYSLLHSGVANTTRATTVNVCWIKALNAIDRNLV